MSDAPLSLMPDYPESLLKPRRVQIRRVLGWRMPANTVKVCRPSGWGNPFKVGPVFKTRSEAVAAYRFWINDPNSTGYQELVPMIRRDLRGKNLACFCPPGEPCHADVLLEIANS